MIRRTYSGPMPALTGGDDRPTGLCSLDPYWFDQAAGDARAADMDYAIRQAKAICDACPLTGPDGPCIRDNPDAPGVVGGLTRMERSGLRKQAPCGTESAYRRHRKKGETCHTCSNAATQAMRDRRARKKAAA